MPENFENCIETFLGNLVDHPAISEQKLMEVERIRLEANFTVEELDTAMEKCNMHSAPGLEGFSNKAIKKFWVFFRVPLLEYANECVKKGKLTEMFRTALIKLIPQKRDLSQIKKLAAVLSFIMLL